MILSAVSTCIVMPNWSSGERLQVQSKEDLVQVLTPAPILFGDNRSVYDLSKFFDLLLLNGAKKMQR